MTAWLRRTTLVLLVASLSGCAGMQPLSAHAESVSFGRKITDAPTKILLDVKHIPQDSLLCVPTSASMIMDYYGDAQSPRKLKAMSRGRYYVASETFNDFSITLYRELIKAAAALGYNWSERTFGDDAMGFQRGLETIKGEIERGRLVMVDVSAPDGHTFVIAGFDDMSKTVSVVDPNAPAPGRYSVSYDRLQSIWNEHAFDGRFRSLVMTSKKGS